jgi:hypothetical protein
MIGMSTVDIIGIISAIAATAAAWYAAITYRSNSKLRRAETLRFLFEKFYEDGRYSKVRHAIDYLNANLTEIEKALWSEQEYDIVDEFVDYLNFFEFIGGLLNLGQIENEEVVTLFDYDLGRLKNRPIMVEFIQKQGFENLTELFNIVKRVLDNGDRA